MGHAKAMRSAGAASVAAVTVVAGIVVNLGILRANPNGPGDLALGAQRAAAAATHRPSIDSTASRSSPTVPAQDATRVIIHVPTPAIARTYSPPRPATAEPGADVPTTTDETPTSTTVDASTTTTVRDPGPPEQRTYRVAHAGSIDATWVDATSIAIEVHPRRGWRVTVRTPEPSRVIATFRNAHHTLVWSARIVDSRLETELRRLR